MEKSNLNDMVRGWFVGNFEPSLFKTESCEVAIKQYKKDDYEERHFHKIATEITAIISGSVKMNEQIYKQGDIVVIKPNESTDFKALEDCITCVVKIPGASNDKYLGESKQESTNFTKDAPLINVVIPAAGLGSRFSKAGFTKPKPFIDVAGKPMLYRVLDNLNIKNANYIIIAQNEHLKTESRLVSEIKKNFNAEFIGIDGITEGTACTLLYARDLIDSNIPLLIANSDQIVDIDMNEFINDCFKRKLDGSILTFKDIELNPKWSFVRLDSSNLVNEVREKEVISEFATIGIYLFSKGSIFIKNAIEMIVKNERVNNEFYTAPSYNYAIKKGAKIGIFNVDFNAMHGIGTPQDLEKYLEFLKNN